MMIKFVKNDDRPQLVAGQYVGELKKLEFHPTEEETAKGIVPQFGPYFTFVFKMVQPTEFENAFWSGICSAKRHPKSKLTLWLQAFGVSVADLGEQLDESLLLGKQVRLKLEMNPKSQRLQIVAIAPLSATAAVAPTAPVGFKPASRQPVQATTSQSAPVQRPVVSQPVVVTQPATFSQDMDDIPF